MVLSKTMGIFCKELRLSSSIVDIKSIIMIHYCCENLETLRSLLRQLEPREYRFASEILSGASIGQHIRHVLEFYLCFIASVHHQHPVNYDRRKRDYLIENSVEEACATIDHIKEEITQLGQDTPLLLEGDFSETEGQALQLYTSVFRELAYCLEHTIHHQALMKVVIKELQLTHLLPDNFGIAPATVRHLKKTTQQH